MSFHCLQLVPWILSSKTDIMIILEATCLAKAAVLHWFQSHFIFHHHSPATLGP